MKIGDKVIVWRTGSGVRFPSVGFLETAWGLSWKVRYEDPEDQREMMKHQSPENIFPYQQDLYEKMWEIARAYEDVKFDAEQLVKHNKWMQYGDPSQSEYYDLDEEIDPDVPYAFPEPLPFPKEAIAALPVPKLDVKLDDQIPAAEVPGDHYDWGLENPLSAGRLCEDPFLG